MEWIEKFPQYWVLMKEGKEVAVIGQRGKSFFAQVGPDENHFHAYGILKLQKIEFFKAKKWCESKVK